LMPAPAPRVFSVHAPALSSEPTFENLTRN
jgi:hypothetical protein